MSTFEKIATGKNPRAEKSQLPKVPTLPDNPTDYTVTVQFGEEPRETFLIVAPGMEDPEIQGVGVLSVDTPLVKALVGKSPDPDNLITFKVDDKEVTFRFLAMEEPQNPFPSREP